MEVELIVKGYKIYCETDTHELYDLFIPNKQYRISLKEAATYVPENHKVIAVKRDSEKYVVDFEALKELSQNNEIKGGN